MPASSKRTAEERKAASTPREYVYEGPMDEFYPDAKAEEAGEPIRRGQKVMLSADQVDHLRAYGSRFSGHGVTPDQPVDVITPFPAPQGTITP